MDTLTQQLALQRLIKADDEPAIIRLKSGTYSAKMLDELPRKLGISICYIIESKMNEEIER